MPVLSDPKRSASFAILVAMTILTLILWNLPMAGIVLSPLNMFVTTLHELGHALCCLATGGSVTGMTIVADGDGHSGLTMCQGGIPWLYTQTGYLGTALFGCLFIVIGRHKQRSKPLSIAIGTLITFASLWFMIGTITNTSVVQGIKSVFCGLLLGLDLICAGVKLGPRTGQLLVMFLSVVTALNAMTEVLSLIMLEFGLSSTETSFTDATNMAKLTGVPAVLWSLLWAALAGAMLYYTVRWTYFRKLRK